MNNTSDLDVAIKMRQAREAQEKQRIAEHQQKSREIAQQHQEQINKWALTASTQIVQGVTRASNTGATKGSNILFRHMPTMARTENGIPVLFELHESGKLKKIGSLQFSMDAYCNVHATTSINGTNLPAVITLDSVTQEWAEKIAEAVLVITLAYH